MSELNLAFRVEFSSLESAVACKHFLRAWRDGSKTLEELAQQFAERLPDAQALVERIHTESFCDFEHTTVMFEGNKGARFFYSLAGDDVTEKQCLSQLLCAWFSELSTVTQVVLRESGDDDAFTVYQNGVIEELDALQTSGLIDWLLAQSDETLPVSIYDLPVLFLQYQGDLQAAMEAATLG
jgi:hypothetical protein